MVHPIRLFHKTTKNKEEHLRNHSSAYTNSRQQSPVKRAPIPTLTLRTDVRRMAFLSLDFLRCNKFRFTFFAFVEVHHVLQ